MQVMKRKLFEIGFNFNTTYKMIYRLDEKEQNARRICNPNILYITTEDTKQELNYFAVMVGERDKSK